MPTALWILYDVVLAIAGVWTLDRPLKRNEKCAVALLVALGVAVAAYSGYSDHANNERISALQRELDTVKNGQSFNTGQLNALSKIDAGTLKLLAGKTGKNVQAGANAVANAAVAKIDALGTKVGELQNQLAHLQQHRHLTKAQVDAMCSILSKTPEHFDLAWGHTYEAGAYAKEFKNALTNGCHWSLDYRSELPPQTQSPDPVGILIGVKDIAHPPAGARELAAALTLAHLPWNWANRSAVNPKNAWLVIGEKP